MLQMGFSQANIARAAQAKSPSGLGQGPFNAGSGFITLLKILLLLTQSSRLQGFVFGLRSQTQLASNCLGTTLSTGTSQAVPARELHPDDRLTFRTVAGQPLLTEAAGRTSGLLLNPINL